MLTRSSKASPKNHQRKIWLTISSMPLSKRLFYSIETWCIKGGSIASTSPSTRWRIISYSRLMEEASTGRLFTKTIIASCTLTTSPVSLLSMPSIIWLKWARNKRRLRRLPQTFSWKSRWSLKLLKYLMRQVRDKATSCNLSSRLIILERLVTSQLIISNNSPRLSKGSWKR